MSALATLQDDHQWLVDRTGVALTDGARGIKAVDDGDRIWGMVVFDAWTDNSCQLHIAADSPVVLRVLVGPLFSYPFLEAERGVIIGIVPEHNQKSLNIAERFGFKEVSRIRDGFARHDDLVVLEMRKEDCRWILRGVNYGRKLSATS